MTTETPTESSYIKSNKGKPAICSVERYDSNFTISGAGRVGERRWMPLESFVILLVVYQQVCNDVIVS
jgi:hypothetical protein